MSKSSGSGGKNEEIFASFFFFQAGIELEKVETISDMTIGGS
jgi:hypothetical protein